MEIGIFIGVVVVWAGFSVFAFWEEARDRKIMNDLFFGGLETASKVAEENAEHEALVLKAKSST
jgi:hypothetical protein